MSWDSSSEATHPDQLSGHFLHLRLQGNVLQEHQRAFEELFPHID